MTTLVTPPAPGALALPSSRDEAWRYTPVSEIGARLADAGAAPDVQLPEALVEEEAGRHGSTRIVLVNGVFSPELSDREGLPPGVRLENRLTDPALLNRTTPAWDPLDGFDARNRSAARDVIRLHVHDGVQLDEPIHIVHLAAPRGDGLVASPRIVVAAGADSRLSLVETYAGTPGSAVTNAATILGLDTGADVTVHRTQNEAADAFHVGHMHVTQHARSTLRVLAISRGSAIARLDAHVLLAGPEARATLTGLSAPRPDARHDTMMTVDHAASSCTSNQAFRTVVGTRARSSFSGRIIVRPRTVATDAHQRSDSLLLSPDAQADSRPWLEIFADDVRCGHGSATGRIDQDALFYLRSRGIPEALARQALVQAFARSVTEQITPPTLRHQVEGWLEPEVDR